MSVLNEDRYKKILQDNDEDEFVLLGQTTGKELTSQDRENLRKQAILYYHRNPWIRNIIRLFEKYVVGRGFQITPKSEMPQVQEYWDQFWRTNKMDKKKKEIVRRSMRDGETFIRYFKENDMLVIRFMNPDNVKDPDENKAKRKATGKVSHGIETANNDIEKTLAYWYNDERIRAEEILHDKILVDSDVKRGRSFIEAAASFVSMYDKWIKDRMKLNMIRALMGLVKKVAGSPTDAANITEGYQTTKQKAPDGSYYHRAPEGVSVYTTNKGVEYEFMTPNLQAADVQKDGRAVLLAICASVGLPEFIVTSDASNSNFASTMIAESPGIMEFEDWQDHFGCLFKELYERAIQTGIKANKIPRYEMVEEKGPVFNEDGEPVRDEMGNIVQAPQMIKKETSVECYLVFPDLVPRDIKEETEALVLQSNQGWLSDHSAAAKLDLDYEEEKELIKKEMDEEMGGEEAPDDHSEDDYKTDSREEEGEGGIEDKGKPKSS